MGEPKVGFWLVRPVARGPFVPARIFWHVTTHEPGAPENAMDRSPLLSAEVNGNPVDLYDVWHRRGDPITAEEHDLALIDAMAGIYPARTWAKA